ncbi:kinase-like protein [Sanghuangporus baumii]|uniref:Kinase-like protein n=1 Tax=Sanghuangporus baumii TaxID=108892 RepID=A0A9Q5N614_SANBA|nr:kinase-like protein [Sanghuangporus baumii]
MTDIERSSPKDARRVSGGKKKPEREKVDDAGAARARDRDRDQDRRIGKEASPKGVVNDLTRRKVEKDVLEPGAEVRWAPPEDVYEVFRTTESKKVPPREKTKNRIHKIQRPKLPPLSIGHAVDPIYSHHVASPARTPVTRTASVSSIKSLTFKVLVSATEERRKKRQDLEKNIMRMLRDDPKRPASIVEYVESFEEDEDPLTGEKQPKICHVMEHCKGPTLYTILKHNRFSNAELVRVISLDIANGLSFLHKNRIVHCDLKPENIMFSSEKQDRDADSFHIRIIDFGLSIQLKTPELNKDVGGTLLYHPPEVFGRERIVSVKMDMWAFGVVIWEIIHGLNSFPIKPISYSGAKRRAEARGIKGNDNIRKYWEEYNERQFKKELRLNSDRWKSMPDGERSQTLHPTTRDSLDFYDLKAKKLGELLLLMDPHERLAADAALPFLEKPVSPASSESTGINDLIQCSHSGECNLSTMSNSDFNAFPLLNPKVSTANPPRFASMPDGERSQTLHPTARDSLDFYGLKAKKLGELLLLMDPHERLAADAALPFLEKPVSPASSESTGINDLIQCSHSGECNLSTMSNSDFNAFPLLNPKVSTANPPRFARPRITGELHDQRLELDLDPEEWMLSNLIIVSLHACAAP